MSIHDQLEMMSYEDDGTTAINLILHKAMVSMWAELEAAAKEHPMVETQLDSFELTLVSSRCGTVDRVIINGDSGSDYAESYHPKVISTLAFIPEPFAKP